MTEAEDESFHIKSFRTKAGSKSVVLQNHNGPCALLAIVNALALRDDTPMAACVSSHKELISEETLKLKLGEVATQMNADDECMDALLTFMPKLSQGLDINPRFNGTFAPSPELSLFRAFNIPVVHAWVLGPNEQAELGIEDEELANLSYEGACELQFSDKPVPALGHFLEVYASQMTLSGVERLRNSLNENELAVMFWNNHFTTIVKIKDTIYSLVTDLGFQSKEEIVWEEIDSSGAGNFVNGKFRPSNEQEKADEALARHLAETRDDKDPHRQSKTREQNHHKRKSETAAKTSTTKEHSSKGASKKSSKKHDCVIF